jgi:peptide/nickel transport system permease protein
LKDFYKGLKENKLALFGGCVIGFLALVALLAPCLSAYDPSAIDPQSVLLPPCWAHPLGTDHLGRDLLSRVIWGTRVSLEVGVISVGIACIVGTLVGGIAGFYGGWIDSVLMRLVDVMLCFPTFFLILAVIAVLEPSIWNIMVVIGVTSWMGIARLVRAEVLSLREREFVLAAKALGIPPRKILLRHILPNALAPVLVAATLGVGAAILTESALSFLGIGVQPPTPSWGSILAVGKDYMEVAWWLSLFPGLAILLTVLGYNLLGEGIRDAVDPRLRRIR